MPFVDACFSASCLYGACLIIFGMLGISFHAFVQRKEGLQRLYGMPVPKHDNSSQLVRFMKAYFLRTTFIQGIILAFLIIRWHADPILSTFISCVVSSMLLKHFREMPTKFIPAATIIIGFAYMVMHMVGFLNGWHTGVLPYIPYLDDK